MKFNIERLNKRARKYLPEKLEIESTIIENADEIISHSWSHVIDLFRVLTPQKRAGLIEKKIILDNDLSTDDDRDHGDAYDQTNDERYEIKHTIVESNGKINFVQIRPWQGVDHLLYVFDMINRKLYKFHLHNDEILEELNSFGQVAHGTALANQFNETIEQALRMTIKSEKFSEWLKKYDPEIEAL